MRLALAITALLLVAATGCERGCRERADREASMLGPDSTLRAIPGDTGRFLKDALFAFVTEADMDPSPTLIETNDAGLTAHRRHLTMAFTREAKVGEMNELLAELGADIISMHPNAHVLDIRVPDPGSLDALIRLGKGLEAYPFVRWAMPHYRSTTD